MTDRKSGSKDGKKGTRRSKGVEEVYEGVSYSRARTRLLESLTSHLAQLTGEEQRW